MSNRFSGYRIRTVRISEVIRIHQPDHLLFLDRFRRFLRQHLHFHTRIILRGIQPEAKPGLFERVCMLLSEYKFGWSSSQSFMSDLYDT